MIAHQFDLVVLGAGTAARGAAMRVRGAGWSVAVVDCKPYGGTCALRGCEPKKMLIGGASVIDHAGRMRGKGVAGDVHIDWPDLMAFKRSFTDPVPQKQEDSYTAKGIATFHGEARFSGPNSVEIAGRALNARYMHCSKRRTGSASWSVQKSGSNVSADGSASGRFSAGATAAPFHPSSRV